MKFNWKILAVIALALGLVVGVPVAAHYRAQGASWNRYRKQLTARGRKTRPRRNRSAPQSR